MNFKKENFILLLLLFPLGLSLWNLLTIGIHSYVVMPFSRFGDLNSDFHSWSLLCITLSLGFSYYFIESRILYRFCIAFNLALLGIFFYDGIWVLLFDFAYEISLVNLFYSRMVIVGMLLVLLFVMVKVFKIQMQLPRSFFIITGFWIIILLVMYGYKYSSFTELYDVGNVTLTLLNPNRLELFGVFWAVTKALGYFMWLTLIKRSKK